MTNKTIAGPKRRPTRDDADEDKALFGKFDRQVKEAADRGEKWAVRYQEEEAQRLEARNTAIDPDPIIRRLSDHVAFAQEQGMSPMTIALGVLYKMQEYGCTVYFPHVHGYSRTVDLLDRWSRSMSADIAVSVRDKHGRRPQKAGD